MRWNCPPTAAASDLTDSVLARPGTPSTSRCPPQSRATAIRSSSTSWPTIVRFTSKSTGCSGLLAVRSWLSVIGLLRPDVAAGCRSYLRSPWPGARAAAERGTDGHGEPDARERVFAVGSGERHDDPDDHAARVEQRPARTARIDRRIELDEAGALARVGIRGPVEAGNHPGGHAVGQAERVADRDDRRADAGAAAEGRGHDDLGNLRRGQDRDVKVLAGRGDARRGHRPVGERDRDGPAARDDMVRGQDRAGVAHDDTGPEIVAGADADHGRRDPLGNARPG